MGRPKCPAQLVWPPAGKGDVRVVVSPLRSKAAQVGGGRGLLADGLVSKASHIASSFSELVFEEPRKGWEEMPRSSCERAAAARCCVSVHTKPWQPSLIEHASRSFRPVLPHSGETIHHQGVSPLHSNAQSDRRSCAWKGERRRKSERAVHIGCAS